MAEQIELLRAMIETITANEQRRQQVTNINTSLLVAGMAALGGIKDLDPIYIALPALPLASIWLLSIHYFRCLAAAKWAVVHEMESHLGAKPFTIEWQKFKEKHYRLPISLTQLEMIVPLAILIVSSLYLLFRLQHWVF